VRGSATRVRDDKPELIRLGPHQWRALEAMFELRLIFGNEIPLKAIQDRACGDDAKCRKGVTDGLRRLRKRGLVGARGARRGLRYIVTQQLIELYQISKRKKQCFKRTRSTRPVDAPWGTTLRVYKLILERRGMFTREIEGMLGISRTAARYQINKLKKLDLVREPFPGYVEPAPPDMERVERALEAAGELRTILEAVGLIYANGRIQLKPFTAKEYRMVKKDGSLRKAQRELKQLKDKAIIIRLPGRRCRFGVYIINPIYPVQIPQHTHDRSTKHLYGGQRVWRRRKSSSSCRSRVRVGRGILGGG
jgi:predicted DNA-binding transcriptional regulator